MNKIFSLKKSTNKKYDKIQYFLFNSLSHIIIINDYIFKYKSLKYYYKITLFNRILLVISRDYIKIYKKGNLLKSTRYGH